MSVAAIADFRTPAGRFAPGRSGNPAGRPKGARSRTTLWAEALLEGEIEDVMRRLIAAGKAGDVRALQFLVSRLVPPARRRAVELDIAPGKELDLRHAFAATIRGLADGEITPEEGALVARVLSAAARLAKVPQPARARVPAQPAARPRAPVSSRYPASERGATPVSNLYPGPPAAGIASRAAPDRPPTPPTRQGPESDLRPIERQPMAGGESRGRQEPVERLGAGEPKPVTASLSRLVPEMRAAPRSPLSRLYSTTAIARCVQEAGAPM